MAEPWVEQWVADVTATDTWAQVVARVWADTAFGARLVANPTAVLREVGLAVPAGLAVWVQAGPGAPEAAAHGVHLVLPPKPAAGELTEEALASPPATGTAYRQTGPYTVGKNTASST